jgi:hypothetical protein
VDDRKTSTSSHDPDGQFDADAAPKGPGARRSLDMELPLLVSASDPAERLPANPLREDRVVVYYGNPQRVSEGFAIALRAMGVEGHVGLSIIDQNREDN